MTLMAFQIRQQGDLAGADRHRQAQDEQILRDLLADVNDGSNRYGRFALLTFEEIGAMERTLARARRNGA